MALTYKKSKDDPRCTYAGIKGYLFIGYRLMVVGKVTHLESGDTLLELWGDPKEEVEEGFPAKEVFTIRFYTDEFSAGDVVEVEYAPSLPHQDVELHTLDRSVLPRIIQKAVKP